MNQWATAYPRRRGPWTVADPDGTWGLLDPEAGTSRVVDPVKDPELPAMSAALQRGSLMGYRVGRRAIVALPHSFIKVVRPQRTERLVDTHRLLAESCPSVSFPQVLHSDQSGWMELTPVPGRSLHQLLRSQHPSPTVLDALDEIGSALAAFHSTTPPSALAPRNIDAAALWIGTICRAEPNAEPELIRIAEFLPPLPPAPCTMVHGDLHDKNIFASTSGVAMIDLDGVGLGSAEDDVANLSVHIQLRSLQAGHQNDVGAEHVERMYRSYQSLRSLVQERLDAVERHTWFRLACLYRFRRTSRHLVPELLRRAIG